MFKNLKDVEHFLYSHIPKTKVKYPGKFGLRRIKAFLKLLDNPQDKIKVVHVAGTSGKGSTAYFTSVILRSLGFKVGLKLSPHLIDFRERFQINNQLLSEEKIVKYFNELLPTFEKFDRSELGPISYYEILVAAAFYIFHEEKVDWAVIETMMGGLYDGTNCVNSPDKTVILTRIGLDHTRILGDTISKIAFQKAGIIRRGNDVVSFDQSSEAKKVIKEAAKKKSASLNFIKKNINYKLLRQTEKKIVFNFNFKNLKFSGLEINTPAIFQVENCSLALSAIDLISKKYNFILDKKKIAEALSQANFSGRMETTFLKKTRVILDGAHNPQKISALIRSLTQAFPGEKMDFLVAFKKGKDFSGMIDEIIPLANRIFLTNFKMDNKNLQIVSENSQNISKYLENKSFKNWEMIDDSGVAFEKAASRKPKILVVTGSFYLLSKIYPRIFV